MPASSRPPLSKSEMEVARIVWQLGSATVRQVFEAMPEGRAVEFKTVQTFLRRLEAKGYLRTRRDGRSKVYRPRVRPRQAIKETVEAFVDSLFNGEALPLVQHLIQDHGLTDAEIGELRKMLRQLEAHRNVSSRNDSAKR